MNRSELERELERHHENAFGWALTCCRWDREMAEDVLQDSYLKIVDGRAVFGGRSTFQTWLLGVVRRTAANHRRRAAVRRFVSLSPNGTAPPPELRIEPDTTDSHATARLRAAVNDLPQRQREVLHLVFYQDLTIADAAQTMGVSLGTARTHYERGKAKLRAVLASGGES